MNLGKVAVLMGGNSAEREISLMSGTGVLNALRTRAVDAHAFDPAQRDLAELKGHALEAGIPHVESGPLVRSSYHAEGQSAVIHRLQQAHGRILHDRGARRPHRP